MQEQFPADRQGRLMQEQFPAEPLSPTGSQYQYSGTPDRRASPVTPIIAQCRVHRTTKQAPK